MHDIKPGLVRNIQANVPRSGTGILRKPQLGIVVLVDALPIPSDGEIHLTGLVGLKQVFYCREEWPSRFHEIEPDGDEGAAAKSGCPGRGIERPD